METSTISDAIALESMLLSDGYKVAQAWIKGSIAYHRQCLETCPLDDVKEHQVCIRTYNSIEIGLRCIIRVGRKSEL